MILLIILLQTSPTPSPTDPENWFQHRIKVTAYCPCASCCGPYADGKTSRGNPADIPSGVAADPRVLPYGTRLWIPGAPDNGNGSYRSVDDTGGAMRQSARREIAHIDLRFRTHDEARAWGVQWLDVWVRKTRNR